MTTTADQGQAPVPSPDGTPAVPPSREQRLRDRLLGVRPSADLWAWVGPLVIAAVGGFFRFWHLGNPHQLVFDETYYVKQGSSLLSYGYERSVAPSLGSTPDSAFTNGTTDVWANAPDFVVHPPLGKWVIGLGEWLFGADSSFGWRFSVALCGTLSILMVARIGRRLFGSTLLGCTAGVLVAFDGHHFVHSRTGLLDLFVMFWALAAFGALLVDRDHARARLAVLAARAERVNGRIPGRGPRLGVRPWRLLAALFLGFDCATKWSGLYFLVVFGLMTVLWDMGARRAAGVERWWLGGVVRDGVPAFLTVVPIALVTYVAAWSGWFASKGGWDRQWAAQHPAHGAGSVVPDALRSLWKYHQEMYHFNVTLSSSHPYKTNPWSWLIQGRPTSFFYESKTRGQEGCLVAQCSKAITSIGTPTLWWGGTLAVFVLLFMWALRRDWRAGAILAGFVGGYLPWFAFQGRTIYSFYSIAFEPWLVLGVVYVLGLVVGPVTASARRRVWGIGISGAYVVVCVILFFYFWPLYTAQVIPYSQWAKHMWFPSWI